MTPHADPPPDKSAHSQTAPIEPARDALRLEGAWIIMPGMATAHSHAFQRLLRGHTQRRADAGGTFWSWRGLMYALAEQMDPAGMVAVARLAFAELAISGVTAVGEFHYLHHAPGGAPYADRLEMSHAVIHAAREVGLRITLIRTAYMRGGFGQPLTPAQARFADADVAAVINDVEELRKAYAHDPTVAVAVAAHSIRAVPMDAV
ncbi:MAG: amidohydrolase family protein, partial [Caldilineaceae bacterium]|nr:amidohydrolase family protein [Caldilineaceae bacterium]